MTVAKIPSSSDADVRNVASTIIYVCTTCRRPDDPNDVPRSGAALAAATARAAESSGVTVQPLRCLANCTRGCSAVIRRADTKVASWVYVFGHLDPAADAQALVHGAELLAQSTDGLMPWRGRPKALKRGLIARVPPFDFQEQSE